MVRKKYDGARNNRRRTDPSSKSTNERQIENRLHKKKKVSPSHQIQLIHTPLERRRQYKLKVNARWLESIEAARRKKLRHDEKQEKRDRNIHLFLSVLYPKIDKEKKEYTPPQPPLIFDHSTGKLPSSQKPEQKSPISEKHKPTPYSLNQRTREL